MSHPTRRQTFLIALAAALGTTGVGAAVAATQDGPTPVAMGVCNAQVSEAGSRFAADPADIGYQFTNLKDVTAKTVVTKITYGNASWYFEDHGTFSQGAAIDRNMIGALPVSGIAPMTCQIARVDYVDGTSWNSESAIVSVTP